MKIEIVNVVGKEPGLGEIYQDMDTKQALLRRISDTKYERYTPFVKCRDFLVDVYSIGLGAKKQFSIWGFEFDGANVTPDNTGVYIMLKFPNATAKNHFEENLGKLHEIEEQNGYTKTVYHELSTDNGMVIGHKKWLKSCLTFSLYSFLLRVLCYPLGKGADWLEKFGKGNKTDCKYVGSIKSATWKKVLDDLSILYTEEFCGFDPKKTNTHTIHHNSGFISVFGSHTELSPEAVKKNAHWKHMKELGLELHTK